MSTTGNFDDFDIDAITIKRRAGGTVDGGGNFGGITWTTVWSGNADLQEGGGETYLNPAGAVEVAEALLFVDADPLPTVNIDDIVVRGSDSKAFTVKSIKTNLFAFPHLELGLKRGPLNFQQQ